MATTWSAGQVTVSFSVSTMKRSFENKPFALRTGGDLATSSKPSASSSVRVVASA